MLSILIPIYNFDVRKLIHTLHAQCVQAEIQFEILGFDDGSTDFYKEKNREIENLTHVIYRELPVNHGRSKIRNLLGKTAQYDYLLYLDGDTMPNDDHFIDNYLAKAETKTTLCGGISYQTNPPKDSNYKLHWHYGTHREAKPATERNKMPYHSFLSGNFFIPRAVFLSILFEENITEYGHEDTVFGFDLKTNHYPILHIDNPVEHLGLETTERYLEKNRKAIANLIQLKQTTGFDKRLETKLLDTSSKLKKYGLLPLYRLFFRLFRSPIESNLKSDNPSLFLFDLWKLGRLVTREENP